jgi:hypothetical protein
MPQRSLDEVIGKGKGGMKNEKEFLKGRDSVAL